MFGVLLFKISSVVLDARAPGHGYTDITYRYRQYIKTLQMVTLHTVSKTHTSELRVPQNGHFHLKLKIYF